MPCGLHKTNGRPRANNTAAAAVWAAPEYAVPKEKSEWEPWQNTSGFGQCSDFLRTACDPTSVFAKIPTQVAFNATATSQKTGDQWPTLYSDVARFLLVRGPYSCEHRGLITANCNTNANVFGNVS